MQIQQYYLLALSVIIFALPFLANIYFKEKGLKRALLNYVKSFSIVGLLLTLLMSFIVERGDIQFNNKFTTGLKLANLPIESITLLFAIGFASIALYELISVKFKEKKILLDNAFFYLFAFTYFALSIVFSNYEYTSTIFFLNGVLMIAVSYFRNNNVFLSKNFYVFSLISVITFILVSAILTMTSMINYSTSSIAGFRIGSIPFEDFFFSFFILSSLLTVYYFFKKKVS